MLKTMLAIVDSFEWGAPAPFPDGVYMCYSEFGNYEFAYPQGWQAGTADNTYYFQDSNTGATLSVSAFIFAGVVFIFLCVNPCKKLFDVIYI